MLVFLILFSWSCLSCGQIPFSGIFLQKKHPSSLFQLHPYSTKSLGEAYSQCRQWSLFQNQALLQVWYCIIAVTETGMRAPVRLCLSSSSLQIVLQGCEVILGDTRPCVCGLEPCVSDNSCFRFDSGNKYQVCLMTNCLCMLLGRSTPGALGKAPHTSVPSRPIPHREGR